MAAVSTASLQLFSTKNSLSSLPCLQLRLSDSKCFLPHPSTGSTGSRQGRYVTAGVRCNSIGATTEVETAKKRRSKFEIQTLTSWLLKQEQSGVIDAELTIVISSISMACKQIAALVQRAPISNLTGIQGAVNVQGEDQKKLDVVSNEVLCSLFFNHKNSCVYCKIDFIVFFFFLGVFFFPRAFSGVGMGQGCCLFE